MQQPQRFHPHQYTNTVPRASTSTSASTSNPRVFTAPISNAHQMSYEAAALRQNTSNAIYDSRGIPQVPQPAYVPYAPPLYTAPPSAPQPALSQDTSSATFCRYTLIGVCLPVISGQTQASQAPQASYQPRYGTSTASSLDGALGAGTGPAPQSVPHAKVTYSSRANQSAPEAPRPSNPPQQSDNTYQEQQLFAFFRVILLT